MSNYSFRAKAEPLGTFATKTASFFSVLTALLIFSLSLAGVAMAQEGNTRLGENALVNNTEGDQNTAIGAGALFSNTLGNNNTASGALALPGNTTGDQNTAIGVGALFSNTTGDFNTASGVATLAANTTGNNNTASGVNALFNNTTGDFNTAIGVSALTGNTIGSQNTASGYQALFSNTTGIANNASGLNALVNNTTGSFNTANGRQALVNNTTGLANTGIGLNALFSNTTGNFNTAIGNGANVSTGDLTNATAIGNGATVDASNKIRLGSTAVTVIEGAVAFTASSDKTQKENFKPVDGEEVLGKIRWLELSSWNFIGHDPKEFRHYGPMAQDFFAAFGYDGFGQIGTETTINSGDIAGILMIAVQAPEKRTAELKQKEAQMAVLESRLEALELRQNHPMQITAGKNLSSVTTGE
jgi:trimeric autotransporter adhesin